MINAASDYSIGLAEVFSQSFGVLGGTIRKPYTLKKLGTAIKAVLARS
jgi:hypothetical protein